MMNWFKDGFSAPEKYYNQGIEEYQKKNYGRAIEFFEKALESGFLPAEAYYNIGLARISQNFPDEAEFNFKKALKYNPEDADSYYNIGLLLSDQERFEEAIAYFIKASEYKSDDSEIFAAQGNAYLRTNRIGEAIDCYEQAHAVDPENVNYIYSLAQLYEARYDDVNSEGDIDKALSNYLDIAQIEPNNEKVYVKLAVCSAKKGNVERAEEFSRIVLKLNSECIEAMKILADALFFKGEVDAAVHLCKKVLAISSGDIDAYRILGFAYKKNKKYTLAKKMFHKYLEYCHNHAETFEIRKIIEQIDKTVEKIEDSKQ